MDTIALTGPSCPRYLVGFDLRRRPHLEADVLVLGGGVAGFAAALAAADAGAEVLLLAKDAIGESNTVRAQGGIAAVMGGSEREAGDSIDRHLQDTLVAGAGLCDAATTASILAGGEDAIGLLRSHGCRFDLDGGGRPDLTREGGHSFRRILHADGDSTGREIGRSLAAAVAAHPRITVVDQAFSIDLIAGEGGRVVGVLYHRRDELVAALAGATVLATGGCGCLWRETTNPPCATGDGLAMAYRAGAPLADLEFMQFHPTTLYIAGGVRLLITEAMRGEGAVLKNHQGERFMPRYHPDAELAPRDVVTRAIIGEIRRTGFPHVWLDATHLGAAFVRERFPSITTACARFGIDPGTEWLPVHPSAHYHCGGVLADAHGVTAVPGLFAAGEVACTGLHGANRLASNSLLEGLVVGLRAGRGAAAAGGAPGRQRVQVPKEPPVAEDLDIADLARSLRATMWRQVGIERSNGDLATARRSFSFWAAHQALGTFRTREGWELQNMLIAASLVTAAAERRTASVGTHCRSDHQGAVDPRHTVFRRP
jgi:L-aspartate oxidase